MVQWSAAQGDDQSSLQECPGWTAVVKLRGALVGQLRETKLFPSGTGDIQRGMLMCD